MENIEECVKKLKEMINVQKKVARGEYMIGVYNGLIFSLSLLTGEEPKYLECRKSEEPENGKSM